MKLVIFSPTTGFVNEQHGITNDPDFAVRYAGKTLGSPADPREFGLDYDVTDAIYVDPTSYSYFSRTQMLERLWKSIEGMVDGDLIAKEVSILTGVKVTYNEDSIWYNNGEILGSDDLEDMVLALDMHCESIARQYNAISINQCWVASVEGFYYKANNMISEISIEPSNEAFHAEPCLDLFKQQMNELMTKATKIAGFHLVDSDYKTALTQAIEKTQALVEGTKKEDIK